MCYSLLILLINCLFAVKYCRNLLLIWTVSFAVVFGMLQVTSRSRLISFTTNRLCRQTCSLVLWNKLAMFTYLKQWRRWHTSQCMSQSAMHMIAPVRNMTCLLLSMTVLVGELWRKIPPTNISLTSVVPSAISTRLHAVVSLHSIVLQFRA